MGIDKEKKRSQKSHLKKRPKILVFSVAGLIFNRKTICRVGVPLSRMCNFYVNARVVLTIIVLAVSLNQSINAAAAHQSLV